MIRLGCLVIRRRAEDLRPRSGVQGFGNRRCLVTAETTLTHAILNSALAIVTIKALTLTIMFPHVTLNPA